MNQRTIFYWICQLTGWGAFVLGNVFIATLYGGSESRLLLVSVLTLVAGIGLTHTLRFFIHRWNWGRLGLSRLPLRILVSALLLGLSFVLINTAISDLVTARVPFSGKDEWRIFFLNVLNFSVVFLIWEIIYFSFLTFRNWKEEEIMNLELRAAKTEIELNSFKSQLNPHFLFNSLNSIRALVDENPEESKRAITMLSGILRNSLMLGRTQTVPLKQELELVEKYLSIEKIRFEERLQVSVEVGSGLQGWEIPPFMIQTLVENGIKHGISKLTEGGLIHVNVFEDKNRLVVRISNSGYYDPKPGQEGIGVANTIKRLELIFGSQAQLRIYNRDGLVFSELWIPNHHKV